MSSAICQNFVQNAWKKELCSNCFKSKDEHAEKPKPKPVHLLAADRVEGIIKKGKTSKPKQSVAFLKDLTEVIGYGGEDWSSDTEEEETGSSEEDDTSVESDEEEFTRELQRITKENTDFNTTSLGDVVEVKKSYTQLLLGKPVVDSSGKKKTLLVSVTPFGEDASAPPKKYGHKNLSHIPIAKNNKEVVAEHKTSNVVLTSYTKNEENSAKKGEKSLLDEISETLENGKNPIQIMAKKKSQKEVALNGDSNKENVENGTTEGTKLEIVEEKSVEHKIVVSEKKISLARTPALKRDIEKPVIYQTSTAKIELLNSKNAKMNKEAVNKMKTEVNNNEKVQPATKSTETKDELTTTFGSIELIKAERGHSNEIIGTKERKDEINNTVAEKVVGIPPPIPPKYIPFSQSREQAGIPDGREDPVVAELPPLPITPPPTLETQTSFLHGIPPPIYEKPKILSKPAILLPRKPAQTGANALTPNLSSFAKPPDKASLSSQDSNDLDAKNNKRKAPQPPEELVGPIYSGLLDSPVVREKRPAALSYTPSPEESIYVSPEHSPKRCLSVSTDCLATDEKRKEKSKARFSLKKFLRMGSSKDITKLPDLPAPKSDEVADRPLPKPRPVIVHPSELNGAKVEVVAATDLEGDPRGGKPPPPPRNLAEGRPRPPPPKSSEVVDRQRQQMARSDSGARKPETVYANIGEVRSAIAPSKPVRTASMREREAQAQLRQPGHSYEPVGGVVGENKGAVENVYDYIHSGRSSSPDSDSSRGKGSPRGQQAARLGLRAGSSVDVSGEYFKGGNIPRSVSLTYCGSETESEIYAPHSFYGSESEVTEDDHDWIQNGRTHKLRSRKGRSIVHKNLEDNYGAVVVANHEALAQVLENVQQSCHIQPALRGLKAQSNLRWADFSLKSGTAAVTMGSRVFHQAVWGAHHVTLLVNAGAAAPSTLQLGTFSLTPVTEFSDLVPDEYLSVPQEGRREGSDGQTQATISVLPCIQVNSIPSYCETVKSKIPNMEEQWKDANFIMLQLVNALKTLQAQGIEELPLSLTSFVLCKDMDKDSHHRLCVLQGLASDLTTNPPEDRRGSLCACALRALSLLQPSPRIAPPLHSLLAHERAVSLTHAKSVLEFSLWGPSDVALGCAVRERELALQRWLDLQRATVLHGLVCARVQLTVREECHLLFLVRSNARLMCDASMLIEAGGARMGRGDKGA